jgi:hypothetical protein
MCLRDGAVPKRHGIPRLLLPSQTALPELYSFSLSQLVRRTQFFARVVMNAILEVLSI